MAPRDEKPKPEEREQDRSAKRDFARKQEDIVREGMAGRAAARARKAVEGRKDE
ncbi:MAG: hypothetical protein KF895_11520 [Parvibaculum sp.]|nr:hypothetical protein [Parvibaculum sp.]